MAKSAAPAPPASGTASPAGGSDDTTLAVWEPAEQTGGAEAGQAAATQGPAVPRHAVQAAQAAGWRPNKLTGPGAAAVRTPPADVANPQQVTTPTQMMMRSTTYISTTDAQ